MLDDSHLKILFYEHDSGKVFPNTYITGGVAVSYRDKKDDQEDTLTRKLKGMFSNSKR